MKRILFLAALAAATAVLMRLLVVETIYIASGSMEPTLATGMHLFSDKVTLRLRAPERGEIVVFHSPLGEHDSVKRVIAVAGDMVELREKKVFLNNSPLDEPYVQYVRHGEKLAGDTVPPMTVPQGHVFVLGDNRDTSSDSATWKDPQTGERIFFLPVFAITGKVRGAYRKG